MEQRKTEKLSSLTDGENEIGEVRAVSVSPQQLKDAENLAVALASTDSSLLQSIAGDCAWLHGGNAGTIPPQQGSTVAPDILEQIKARALYMEQIDDAVFDSLADTAKDFIQRVCYALLSNPHLVLKSSSGLALDSAMAAHHTLTELGEEPGSFCSCLSCIGPTETQRVVAGVVARDVLSERGLNLYLGTVLAMVAKRGEVPPLKGPSDEELVRWMSESRQRLTDADCNAAIPLVRFIVTMVVQYIARGYFNDSGLFTPTNVGSNHPTA